MPHKCKVCDVSCSTYHFGVESCRACAIFFRRNINDQRQTIAKCSLKCKIEQRTRRICSHCRLEKCLRVGMRRGTSSEIPTKTVNTEIGPILSKWKHGYSELREARSKAFGTKDKKTSNECTYSVQNSVITIDSKLIISNLISKLHKYEELEGYQKKILLSQFIGPFHILESIFNASGPNIHLLANGDHINYNKLDGYYKNLFDSQHALAFRIFKPYWDLQQKIIRGVVDEVSMDDNEFLFLIAMMFWDIDFHECPESLILLCSEQKSKLMAELCDYEKWKQEQGLLTEDRSMRVGSIVMILQDMQRVLHMCYESHEVSKFYRIDVIHDTFFELLKPQ